jgi:hypothetical protein
MINIIACVALNHREIADFSKELEQEELYNPSFRKTDISSD